MKIHHLKFTYSKKYRSYLFPLLKPFVKEGEFNDDLRKELYAISERDVSFVDDLKLADIALLPLSWNYYIKYNREEEALSYIKLANELNVKVWIVMSGDVGLPIPEFNNIIVLRASGYRSRLPDWHRGIPVFINDPLKTFFQTTTIFERPYYKKPKVGFCGLASNNKWEAAKTLLKIALKNTGYYLKCYQKTPEALISAPHLRYQCLELLKRHEDIDDKFIIRNRYRAGSLTKQERDISTKEFYTNIYESDYILCVRGAGNFSARLFETLAMGRIPIYVNTDSLLPLDDQIDWKKHVVWVEKDEISLIAEKVIAFHQGKDELELHSMFKANRILWETKFQTGTFFRSLYASFKSK